MRKNPPHSKWECGVAVPSSESCFFFPPVSYILTGNWRGRAAARRTNPSSLNGDALAIRRMHNNPRVHTVALLINTQSALLCFYPSKKSLVSTTLRQCNQSWLVIPPVTGRKSIRWPTVGLNWLLEGIRREQKDRQTDSTYTAHVCIKGNIPFWHAVALLIGSTVNSENWEVEGARMKETGWWKPTCVRRRSQLAVS